MKFLPVLFWCALVANAAEVKISELPETNAPSASAVIPIVDAGANWKVQKANLLGSLTNWAKLSTNAANGSWYSYTLTTAEGGTAIGVASTNELQSNAASFAVNFLTNQIADFTVFLNLGFPEPDRALFGYNGDLYNIGTYCGFGQSFTNSRGVFNYGDEAGGNQLMDSVLDIFNYGDQAGKSQNITNTSEVFNFGEQAGAVQVLNNTRVVMNYGDTAGRTQVITGGGDVFNYGDAAGFGQHISGNTFDIYNFGSGGQSQVIVGGSDIYNFGGGAGGSQNLTNASDVYNIGNNAGAGQVGGLTHTFVAGSGGKATNNNDWVAGDANYNYFFPGASSRFDNVATAVSGISSLATDTFLAFTSTGITNTLGKIGNARFDGTNVTYVVKNNAGTPVYTNAVSIGHAFEQIQAGGAIVITVGTVIGTVAPQ